MAVSNEFKRLHAELDAMHGELAEVRKQRDRWHASWNEVFEKSFHEPGWVGLVAACVFTALITFAVGWAAAGGPIK